MKSVWIIIFTCAVLLLFGCNIGTVHQNIQVPEPSISELVVTLEPTVPPMTATCSPTPTSTPTPEPTEPCLHLYNHPKDKFSDQEPVLDEYAYKSSNVSISIEKIVDPEGFPTPLAVFVADIYIESINSFRASWSKNTPEESQYAPLDILEFMSQKKAILAINGDYASKKDFGCLVRDGVCYRTIDNPRYDACILLKDGSMVVLEGKDATSEAIMAMDPWQAWCFGPSLLNEEGKAKNTDEFNSSLVAPNPRTVLGYYSPGHYCFVVVDGRQDRYSKGLTLYQLSRFMESLGCQMAYNMDGGGSSVLAFD
ncbi:MAG: phosphodiester glycosidase family protein, partial [Bacteroidales bacterium]|nr:phosphodiester glycosidase family protein [Bacteroidales bacterium]